MKTTSLLGALQYRRAYTHSINALHTLCCGSGNLRERLSQIDPEYFSLESAAYPDYEKIRSLVTELRNLVSRFEPASPYALGGRVVASIERLHYTKRTRIAQLIWEIHKNFTSYMQPA